MIWINWIGFIFQILVAIGLTATLFYISLREKADAIFPLMIIILIGLVDCGILDASWRNGRYEIKEDGISLKFLLNSRFVKWSDINSYGIFTIMLTNTGAPRDYIVLFLSEERPVFPVNLTYCSFHRKKMLTIRATPARVAEMKEMLIQHQIQSAR